MTILAILKVDFFMFYILVIISLYYERMFLEYLYKILFLKFSYIFYWHLLCFSIEEVFIHVNKITDAPVKKILPKIIYILLKLLEFFKKT